MVGTLGWGGGAVKKIGLAAVAFGFVCLMGAVVGSASGVQWGNADCGFLVGMTLIVATWAGGMTLCFGSNQ